MNRTDHQNVNFFTGIEVEHTPAAGKLTLFVVGVQPIVHIQDWVRTYNCEHIYFGANMSFPNLHVNDSPGWQSWETMIQHFLSKGYLCTLDIDVSCTAGLCESSLCEYNNFIPMISVKIPYVKQLGYNATVKIDDQDFSATNPGVWCHSLHDLMDRSKFTSWDQYTKDEIIK